MIIGNIMLGVNSVTVSYLIHYDSLLQNATAILLQNASAFLLQKATVLLQNATVITSCDNFIKGTVMQIEKALINDRLRVSKVS